MGKAGIQISVVMAVYNSETYLKEAIDSILSQTFTDFELILINDGSTDNSTAIITGYTDSRIRIINNGANQGLIASLNTGLTQSRGKYIARMDADDIALPARLQMQFDFMEAHPEVGLCGTNIETFFDDSEQRFIARFPEEDATIRAFTFFQSPFCHPTVMMRREVIETYKIQYPAEFVRTEDYAMWVGMLPYTQAHNLQIVALRYRKHKGSVTWISAQQNKNINVSLIQSIYFRNMQMTMDSDDFLPFSQFVNRSSLYPLTRENQQLQDRVLRNFFTQLNAKHPALVSAAKKY
ncbi:MAG: glycosyltransferase, partial [Dysgonamonadaceae bacterium]|nr:glycosyltransferase [Dysgonamonadaceae bacterium]